MNNDRTIRGIGIDIERVRRFERLIGTAAGDALGAHAFTAAERGRIAADAVSWAAVFTAKEAAAKALGVGVFPDAGGIACRDMEVTPLAASGFAEMRLTGAAVAVAEAAAVRRIAVSTRLVRGHVVSRAWALGAAR
jgi:phosphopantetheine--protein transferase-like protein